MPEQDINSTDVQVDRFAEMRRVLDPRTPEEPGQYSMVRRVISDLIDEVEMHGQEISTLVTSYARAARIEAVNPEEQADRFTAMTRLVTGGTMNGWEQRLMLLVIDELQRQAAWRGDLDGTLSEIAEAAEEMRPRMTRQTLIGHPGGGIAEAVAEATHVDGMTTAEWRLERMEGDRDEWRTHAEKVEGRLYEANSELARLRESMQGEFVEGNPAHLDELRTALAEARNELSGLYLERSGWQNAKTANQRMRRNRSIMVALIREARDYLIDLAEQSSDETRVRHVMLLHKIRETLRAIGEDDEDGE